MTKRLVGAVGTSSAACPSRGGRVFASTATAASMGHPVTSRPPPSPSRRREKALAKWWGVLFPGGGFGEQLVDEVLTCVEMLNRGDDESIRRRIGEPSYYRNFIGLVAKIAPDGKDITGIGFTTLDVGGTPREVALRRSKESLPTPEPLEVATTRPAAEDKPLVITGRLGFASNLHRPAAHLDGHRWRRRCLPPSPPRSQTAPQSGYACQRTRSRRRIPRCRPTV